MTMQRLTAGLITITVLLAGCTDIAPNEPTPNPVAIASTTSTIVPSTATATVSATLEPVRTYQPANDATWAARLDESRDFLSLPIVTDILFYSSEDSNCKLPCWQGIRPGVSDIHDIQRVFEKEFGLDSTVNFANDSSYLSPAFWASIPGTYSTGYQWQIAYEQDPSQAFLFITTIVAEQETNVIEGIWFSYGGVINSYASSPQKVLREIGTPDSIYAYVFVGPQESGPTEMISLIMVYADGFSAEYTFYAERKSEEPPLFNDICFDEVKSNPDYILTTRLDSPATKSQSLHADWIFDRIARRGYAPIEKALGLNIDKFSELVLSNYPCISLDYDAFQTTP